MYLFHDRLFEEGYNKYYEMRSSGLKKQANEELERLMNYFDSLSHKTKSEICYELCTLYLDEKAILEIQFPLSHRITEILAEDCHENKIPQLRWYYQLTGDKTMLIKAMEQNNRDERTVNLMVDAILYDLWFGSHHMPYCCLLDHEKSDRLLKMVEEISGYMKLSDEVMEEYNYYLNLYNDWWTFEKEQSSKGFLDWCVKHKRKYDWVLQYCYNK